MAPHVFPRQDSSTISNNLAGGLIAGFVVLIVALCFTLHFWLRRSKKDQAGGEQQPGGTRRPVMTEVDPSKQTGVPPSPFSRQRLRASIIMPAKTVAPKPPSPLTGKTAFPTSTQSQPPSPSSPLSPQRPLSKISLTSRPRSMSLLNPACSRQSRVSVGLSVYAPSMSSSRQNSRPSSIRSASPTNVARPVRQAFEPALPDELVLRRGEYITVLQSFDDGWYLVARDGSPASHTSRISSWIRKDKGKEKEKEAAKAEAEDVDIGLVPAWVFVKPLHGVTVTRPMRSSSLNALNLDHQGLGDGRGNIISWSLFS